MGKTVLLVIDAQAGIIEGPSVEPVYRKAGLLEVLKKVIGQARKQDVPVIYIQDVDVGQDHPDEHAIHPAIAPKEGEPVIRKQGTDAFVGTELGEALAQLKAEHLVILGAKTEYCVDTTTRSATARGFDVTVVADGHSTTDNKVLSAEQIIAHHNCNLHGLDNLDRFILVRYSEDDVFSHQHLPYK